MIYEMIYLSTEIDLIDLRLHELDGIVDKFIIVEYPFNYSGKDCTMYYNQNKERFKEFEHKIIHIIDDNRYENTTGIYLNSQRQNSSVLMDAVSFCSDTDFLIVTDGDAIIRKEAFENIDLTKHTCFRMEWCQYWMNVYFTGVGYDWAFGAPISLFRQMGSVVKTQRKITGDIQLIPNSGWHWSKMGGVEKVIENIIGYPHQEYRINPALIDPVLVQERIDNHWGWDEPNRRPSPNAWEYKTRKFDPEYYPKYIGENLDIFSKYIKQVD